VKLTDEIFKEFCTYKKNPGEYVDAGPDWRKKGWLDIADIYQSLETIYSLTKFSYNHKPNVLELGVSDGTTTLAFLKALSEINGPKLISVDKDECQGLAKRSVDFFELGEFWNYRLQTTDKFFAADNTQFDIIFIDADHSYVGAKRDFDSSLSRLKQGGIILIHDAFMHFQGTEHGVSKLIFDIINDGQFNCFVSTIPTAMALVQRKDDILRNYPW
jgi:predicted O-methyltransferase YrrM